jgi:hypothetical protein
MPAALRQHRFYRWYACARIALLLPPASASSALDNVAPACSSVVERTDGYRLVVYAGHWVGSHIQLILVITIRYRIVGTGGVVMLSKW